MREISGRTKTVALFGYPVEHTKSPHMQNAAFAETGIDGCYIAFSVSPGELSGAVQAIRSLGMLGVNLTIPHKEAVLPLLDEIDPEAVFIGAVNTIVNRNGRLCGYNTDGRGFMRSLAEAGIAVAGKRVFMLGAGGAARAVGYYLVQEAASLIIANRTKDKAEQLAADLDRLRPVVSVIASSDPGYAALCGEVDIVINTTSLGLKEGDALPIDSAFFNPRHTVCDLIYHRTPMLQAASSQGARIIDGSGMLLWQGALAFELWTGQPAPVDIMRKALGD